MRLHALAALLPIPLPEKLEELVFDNQEHARIVNNIDNFLSDYEVERGWEFLFDGKTFKGWRSAKGDSFPDRVVFHNPGQISIIDYKTGEEINKHKIQLKEYASRMKELGLKVKNLFLVYTLSTHKVVKI